MNTIVGIRFKDTGKIYYFDPSALELAQGDWAVVETAQGKECGEVMLSPREVPDEQIVAPLKKVQRKATAEDMKIVEERAGKEKHALEVCQEKVLAHNLDMKLVNVEFSFDGSKIVFYFTADGRVDFRALVRDLAAVFRTRIELRQIGVRDEVKMLGGLGPCGREACCKAFLTDFSPVSIRMAKDQNLSLNPTKISGLCGRLMCCLNYEQEHYAATLQRCPRKGATVLTPEGPATVDDVLILKEKVKVRLIGDEVEIREYVFEDVQDATPKDIAAWEASGGRARASVAKAAYKQALNKPKPKPGDEFNDIPSDFYSNDGPMRLVKPDEPALGVGQEMPSALPAAEIKPVPKAAPAVQDLEDYREDDDAAAAQDASGQRDTDGTDEEAGSAADGQPATGDNQANRRRRRGGRRNRGWHGGPRTPGQS
jgi:cell fate regulator YaaT (PSP1 superfamily)